ncbi:hypothetical protein K503DRAFT_777803, partial [Rhizopogon vinicolor AM-OR11-026]
MSQFPAEGTYRIENNEKDEHGSYLYASVYKSSGKDFNALPKSPSFNQEFTLKYVNQSKGICYIRETVSNASAGVDTLENAEPVVTTTVDQQWTLKKLSNAHYSIGQTEGSTDFVWDLKEPKQDHQVRTFPLLFL